MPEFLSWEQLWNFREKVGELMLRANSETYPKLRTIYDDFTKLLKARAEELGKAEEFASADKLTQLLLETAKLRAEMEATDSGLKFHDILNDPARQKELAALQSLIEAGGLPENYLSERRDAVKANYRIAKAGQTGGPIRLRDVLLAWIERLRENRKRGKTS